MLAVVISLKITYSVVDRIFDGKKTGLEPRDSRRIVTLNHVTKTAARAGIWTLAGLIILGQFINVGSLLAVAGVGTLAIGFGAQGIVEDVMSGFVIVLKVNSVLVIMSSSTKHTMVLSRPSASAPPASGNLMGDSLLFIMEKLTA